MNNVVVELDLEAVVKIMLRDTKIDDELFPSIADSKMLILLRGIMGICHVLREGNRSFDFLVNMG